MIVQLSVKVILLSILPSMVISLFILKGRNSDEINKRLYIKLMIAGALAVIPGLMLVTFASSLISKSLPDSLFIRPFLAVALIEELIKLTILRYMLYRNDNLKTVRDGIKYSIAIAVGFAFAENIIYLTGSTDPLLLITSRSFTAVPLHAICGAFMGYFAGRGKTNESSYFGKALLSALIIHGIYNILVSFPFPYYLFSIMLLISTLLLLKQMYSKKDLKKSI